MPYTCFSYSADLPPSAGDRSAAQAALRDLRRMPASCFSYPIACFSYPSDVLPGITNRDAAQPGLRDPRRMPATCFRY